MNLRDLSLRIRALAAPRRVERELHDELAFHLERETQKHVANGLSPAEARNLAMARFGPVVLSQSVRPVGFGLLAGGGLAAGLAIVLMSTPAASEIGNTVRVLDPMAYAASLLVIIIACVLAASVPALRAARVDPIATLRSD